MPQLIITVALKQEIPLEWLRQRGISVHTLAALESGAKAVSAGLDFSGMMVIVTGVGRECSQRAAHWITTNLQPLYVLNIGSAASRELAPGSWAQIEQIVDGAGEHIELNGGIPIPVGGLEIYYGQTLQSVSTPTLGQEFPAGIDVVDMEAGYQASHLARHGIHFSALKWVSDRGDTNADQELTTRLAQLRSSVKELLGCMVLSPQPSISVVIPVHNREPLIGDAIESVLNQTYKPVELIVVDDGSTDATCEQVVGFGDSVKFLRVPGNSGVSAARNLGVQSATGEWIAFLDSDDRWQPEKLERQVEFLRSNPFYQILQSEEVWIRNGRRVNRHNHHAKQMGWIWAASLERCMISPSSVLLAKQLFEQHGGFDEQLPACEDYDLWLRIARHYPVGLEPTLSLIKYGGHADQLSTKYPAMDRFRVYALYRALLNESKLSYRKELQAKLSDKLAILAAGARKRDRNAATKYELLKSQLIEPPTQLDRLQWMLNS